MQLVWTLKHFNTLSVLELYKTIQLRLEVFSIEQKCAYQDLDNKDLDAYFLMGWDGDTLVASTRLLKPGLGYTQMSIGRVVCHKNYRKLGIGKELMQRSIVEMRQLFGNGNIKIGAQCYLKRFYNELGFESTNHFYLEDNIEHEYMILS
ncbi:MAG: GNAT family N-acetyltransferase [Alphaproteobacteria bacterium]|nr:GNAT family N-acetyltransferase [Alphaproteobacteria bacterium]